MVVLLALRPLVHGDELLMDYRLNPGVAAELLPPWYSHCDLAAARRISGVVAEDEDPLTLEKVGKNK